MATFNNIVPATRVVVIGTGLAGSACANELVKVSKNVPLDITLIDCRSSNILKYAGTRAAALGNSFAYRTCIPNSNLVPDELGRVVNKLVKQIDEENKLVICEDGQKIPYQILVCASGAQNVSPCEPPLSLRSAKEQIGFYEEVASEIRAARHVTVLGSGAVGTELAGEIKGAYPNKGVAILSPGPQLVDNCVALPPQKFFMQIEKSATKMGIDLYLKQRPTNIALKDFKGKSYLRGSRELITDAGKKINTELVLICTGKRLNNSFYPKSWLGRHDSIKVGSNLLVVGKTDVFAIGDINDVVETKQGYFAQKQGRLVARNIEMILKRKTELRNYNPHTSAQMIVPLGRSQGVSVFFGVVLGAMVTANTKGKDLFVKDHWSLYGMKSLLIKENDPNWLRWVETSYPRAVNTPLMDREEVEPEAKYDQMMQVGIEKLNTFEDDDLSVSRRGIGKGSFDTLETQLDNYSPGQTPKMRVPEVGMTPTSSSRRKRKKKKGKKGKSSLLEFMT